MFEGRIFYESVEIIDYVSSGVVVSLGITASTSKHYSVKFCLNSGLTSPMERGSVRNFSWSKNVIAETLYMALIRRIRWKSSTFVSLTLVSFCLLKELAGGGVDPAPFDSLFVWDIDFNMFLLFCYESFNRNLVENFSLEFSTM